MTTTTIDVTRAAKRGTKALHIALWIAQTILGVLFIVIGILKTTQPIESLFGLMPWTAEAAVWQVRFVGIAELLGGVGLLLPSMLRILPQLTVGAAAGIATIMMFAIMYHVFRFEAYMIGKNVAILVIAVFVAWGRWDGAPIPSRLSVKPPRVN